VLTIRLLGPIQVLCDGVPVDLTPRAVGLLTRLALAAGPVPRDQLLMDLWGDDVDPARRRSLETLVSTVRANASGRGGLIFRDGAYELTAPVDLDVRHVLDAARALAAGRSTDRSIARAVLVAERGEPTICRLGAGSWIDQVDQSVRTAVDAARTALQAAPIPDVRYATAEGRHLAYQIRDGIEPTVLLYGGLATHCEGIWEAPGFPEWIASAFGNHRLVLLDKRGSGLSDPITDIPTDLDFVEDTIAVLDDAGIDRVVAVCAAEAGLWGPYLATHHADRVLGLVFINATPKMFEADDYPCGLPEQIARRFGESVAENWARNADDNDDPGLGISAPSRAHDPAFRSWAHRYQRVTASPGPIWHLAQYTGRADARDQVRRLQQPAVVLQSRHSRYFRPSTASWLCTALDVDEPVWLDSADHLFWIADPARSSQAIASFLDIVGDTAP
jgi:pimeloyl-ACP methyl ester carboxylesterase